MHFRPIEFTPNCSTLLEWSRNKTQSNFIWKISENKIFNSLFEPSINFVSNSLKIFLKDLERLDTEINENKLSVIKLQDALLNMQEFTEYFPLLMKATSTFMSSGARVIDSSLKYLF